MDLKDISTPAELLEANNTPNAELQTALDAVAELGGEDLKKLLLHTVGVLGEAHDYMAESELRDGNTESAFAWAKDEANLHTIWNILNGIEL